MKQLLLMATSVALVTFSASASANDDAGWYLRGNVGYGVHTDVDLLGGIDSSVHGNGLQSEGNIGASAGIGYDFGNHWRLELDGDTLWTDLGSISQLPGTSAKLRTNSVMLNAIYDFNDFGAWAPYIGAGVGLVQAQADLAAHDYLNPVALAINPACAGARTSGQGVSCSVHDKATDLGWQLLAGLGYDITDNLKWDTHYSYMNASGYDFDGALTNGVTNAVSASHVEADGVGSHTIMTGLRYVFGQKRAKPMVEPMMPVANYKCWDGAMVFNSGQCPARPVEVATTQTCWDGSVISVDATCPIQRETFSCWDGSLVYDRAQCPVQVSDRGNDLTSLCGEQYRQEIIYYEFDKGLSAETRATIGRVLDAGQYCNVQSIRVVGHTDSSGSAAYNLALSERRARDARDELVRQGIAEAVISSEGKGETELFVNTGDGVKEQLNRRTEVLITLGSVGVIN